MLTRRAALAAAALLPLARPAIAQPGSTLRFVPQADLAGLDPIWTTGYVVRNHGYMVYDTLYALDGRLQPRPQMAQGHEVSGDGLVWTIRLRPGLMFHDGTPVRAVDCAASITRWAARSSFGQTLAAVLDGMDSSDDRMLRIRLKSPFPLLPEALGTVSSPTPFIMPERIAKTDPTKQITDPTGSGPFRFLADEWVHGSRAAYARFDGYVPRDEAADGLAGGKRVYLDRVEWLTIPDASTQMSALQTGEVDWVETPSVDLVGLVANKPGFATRTLAKGGSYALLRFNALFPPFDDVFARRAVLAATDQQSYMDAVAGGKVESRDCRSFIPCGMPLSSDEGSAAAMPHDLAQAKALLAQSRYDGRKVIVISPADIQALNAMGEVTADLLRKIGMNVDLQVMDWASLLTRRNGQKAPEDGGWNIFHTTAGATEFMTPATHLALRGNGRSAWAGWPTDAKIEALRTQWFAAADFAAQRSITAEMERAAFADVPYVPLGEFDQPTAYRTTLTGLIDAPAPVMWGMRKA